MKLFFTLLAKLNYSLNQKKKKINKKRKTKRSSF